VALHLEIDEIGNRHEDDDGRIAHIQQSMGVTESWLVRFSTKCTGDRPSCVKRKKLNNGNTAMQRVDGPEWDERMEKLTNVVRQIYQQIVLGQSPEAETWKTMLFFD
jgi:hypothetical protein